MQSCTANSNAAITAGESGRLDQMRAKAGRRARRKQTERYERRKREREAHKHRERSQASAIRQCSEARRRRRAVHISEGISERAAAPCERAQAARAERESEPRAGASDAPDATSSGSARGPQGVQTHARPSCGARQRRMMARSQRAKTHCQQLRRHHRRRERWTRSDASEARRRHSTSTFRWVSQRLGTELQRLHTHEIK